MVRRTEPLVVDVLVTALAGVGLHEELAGNLLFAVDLRGAGKERALGAVALAVHGFRRHGGVLYTAARVPAFADVPRAVADCAQQCQEKGSADGGRGGTARTVAHADGDQ